MVQLAKQHQVGMEPLHPVSLFDMWSPNRLLPTEHEMMVRERAIAEAAKLSNVANTLTAVTHVCRGLRRQLEACRVDEDWAKFFRQQLRRVGGVVPEDMDLLVRYHGMLQNTGQGWTYARSVEEMFVKDPYHPKLLASVMDHMTSTTQLSGERLYDYDPNNEQHQLEEGLATALGSASAHFKQIGILQFFAQADQGDETLKGPTSQGMIPVFVDDRDEDMPMDNFRPQKESDRHLNEVEFQGTLVQEVFIRTNNMKKLYEIRPEELEGMSYCQWLCNYRHVKNSTQEYKRERKALGDKTDLGDPGQFSIIGQRSKSTMIAGTLEMAPKVVLLHTKEMVKLRVNTSMIPMLATEDQVLNDKAKVTLFGHWYRLEEALQDPEPDIKQCDTVRLLLFPSSQHISE